MGRIIWFALFVVAGWYGWNHWSTLRGAPADELVVVNHSGGAIERVRVGVGGAVEVFESVEDGSEVRRPWHGNTRGTFYVVWSEHGRLGEREWRGNAFEPSATTLVHKFEFLKDARVLAHSEPLAAR